MSKASRGIPGQRLMSRLFTRVAARPSIGTSPAFFARFGLEDPWAFGGFGSGPVDSNDPFVFLSAADYYGHMDRLRARQRLMERFRAMEASASAASALGRRRSRSVNGSFRASSLASMALADSVLVAPLAEAPEPQADETASGWVARRGAKADAKAPRKAAVRAAEDRPLVRALRQSPVDAAAPVWRAVADAGLRIGAAERQVIGRALVGIETLAADEQVEVARQVVRRMKGPQRRLAEVAVEDVASADAETPARVAASRMTQRANRKGLRPVLSSSPALVGLRFEDAAEVAAPTELVRRSSPAVASKAVRARGAHTSPPVVAVAGTARTQRAVGRAGPAVAESEGSPFVAARVRAPVTRRVVAEGARVDGAAVSATAGEAAAAAPRRALTERIGARALAAASAAPSEGLDRGTAALEAPLRQRSVRRASSRPAASVLSRSEFVTPEVLSTASVADASAPVASVATAGISRSKGVVAQPAERSTARTSVATRGLARVVARSRSAVGPTIAAPVAGYVREEEAVSPVAVERVRSERSVARAVRPAGASPEAVFARPAEVAPVAVDSSVRPGAVVRAAAERKGVSAARSESKRDVAARPASGVTEGRPVEALVATDRPSQRAIARTVAPVVTMVAPEPMAHARSGAVAKVMQRHEEAPVLGSAERRAVAPVRAAAEAPVGRPVERATASRADRSVTVARRSAAVASPGEMLTARPSDVTPATDVPADGVARTARVPAAARAVARAEAGSRVASVIAPSPVEHVSGRVLRSTSSPVVSEVAAEPQARVGDRIATRSVVAAESDAAVGRVAARADVPSVSKPRLRSDSPEAVLARPAEVVAPIEVAGPAGRPVPAARPAAAARPGVTARPAAASRPAAIAEKVVRTGSTRHAARRMEAFAPVVSAASVQRAASDVVARRSARRAVGPALPHVAANDFRLDVEAPLAAVESRVASASGSASGPVTRASLASVLGRVAAVVRAMERSEAPASVSPAIRRALEEAPVEVAGSGSAARVRRSRVASARSAAVSFDGVFARPAEAASAVESTAPARSQGAPVVRPVVRAERRAALGSTAATRPARRAMAGVSGLTGEALDHIVERSFAPAAESGATAVRYRTLRTADGRFAPLAPESVKPVAQRFGVGRVEIPSASNARSFEVASGLVLPRTAVTVDAEASDAADAAPRAAGGRATAATGTVARAAAARSERAPTATTAQPGDAVQGSARRTPRSFTGTLGHLNGKAPVTSRGKADRAPIAGDRSVEGPRARRTTYDDAGVLVRAPSAVAEGAEGADDTVGAPLQTPGYAKRAIVGTIAETSGRRPVAQHLPPRLSTGSLLTALARADRPEDVVQVILQRGGTLADVEREIPEAAAIVERIARLGGAQAARSSTESPTSGAVEQAPSTQFLSHRSPSASGSRVRRSLSQAVPSNGAGSSQAMKLAQKLMNLIHLAETDRKSEDARRQVRMAEASAEARSEGSASVAAGQTKNLSGENVNIAALQREVLEAVLQALELNHHRRQEDTDVWW